MAITKVTDELLDDEFVKTASQTLDSAKQTQVRTNIGVDASGTQVSTDVTLTGSRDYISLTGQAIAVNQIDISDDTNLAAGTGITLTGDSLSVDYGTTAGTALEGDTSIPDPAILRGGGTPTLGTGVTAGEIRGLADAEQAFSKNTAFNKNFDGTGSATTVARSDHTHSTTVTYVAARCVGGTGGDRATCEADSGTWTGALSITAGGNAAVTIDISTLLVDLQLSDIG